MTTNLPTIEARPASARPVLTSKRYDDLVDVVVPGGPNDGLSIDAVVALLPTLPNWPPQGRQSNCARVQAGAKVIL